MTRGSCVVSVPWEPWFRLGNLARGKNVGRLGNDPEHVQQFGPASLRRRLQTVFHDVEVRRCFPWLVGVCRLPVDDLRGRTHHASTTATTSSPIVKVSRDATAPPAMVADGAVPDSTAP